MKLIGMIADHLTPKMNEGGEVAYTMSSRDYKGVMLVVISEGDRKFDGKRIPEVGNARSRERNVCRGKYW